MIIPVQQSQGQARTNKIIRLGRLFGFARDNRFPASKVGLPFLVHPGANECHPKIAWLPGERAIENFRGFLITIQDEQCGRSFGNKLEVMRIQSRSLLDVLNRLIPASLPTLYHSNKKRNCCVVGEARLGEGKLRQGRPVIERSTIIEEPSRKMYFSGVGLEACCC